MDFARRLEKAIAGANGVKANGVRSEFRTTTPTDAKHANRNSALTPLASSPASLLFPYDTSESIWNEHRESTRGRDLDITGLSYTQLEQAPQQWPCPEGQATGKARLYADGLFPTPDGRARFANTTYKEVAEPRESRFPFSLTTGRLRDQWHGMSRTGVVPRLFGHVAEPAVQLNPQDIARRGLAEGDLVFVTSKRGSIVVPLQGSEEVALGQAFMAMHWGPEYLGGLSSSGQPLAGVNALTTSAFCPDSKQPELKHAAVKILKAELPWTLLALAWLPAESALATREALRALMVRFPFASCVPFSNAAPLTGATGPQRTGVLLRAAAHEPPPDALLAAIETLLRLDDGSVLRYADAKRGQRRAVRLQRSAERSTVEAFLLAGDTRAEVWLKPLLQNELPAQAYGRALLQGSAQAPVAMAAPSRQVCTCFNVSESAIQTQLARCRGGESERLAQLQQALQCGTNCGSCVPELQRLVRATPLQKQAA